MNVAVILVGTALAYLFIVGLALVWIRGASGRSSRFPPRSTRLQGDRVAQELHKS